jgi:hypothetical protein
VHDSDDKDTRVGVIYTGIGASLATQYASVNALLLPPSVIVTLFLLPLLPRPLSAV